MTIQSASKKIIFSLFLMAFSLHAAVDEIVPSRKLSEGLEGESVLVDPSTVTIQVAKVPHDDDGYPNRVAYAVRIFVNKNYKSYKHFENFKTPDAALVLVEKKKQELEKILADAKTRGVKVAVMGTESVFVGMEVFIPEAVGLPSDFSSKVVELGTSSPQGDFVPSGVYAIQLFLNAKALSVLPSTSWDGKNLHAVSSSKTEVEETQKYIEERKADYIKHASKKAFVIHRDLFPGFHVPFLEMEEK